MNEKELKEKVLKETFGLGNKLFGSVTKNNVEKAIDLTIQETMKRVLEAIDKKDNMEKIMKWIWEDGIVIDEMSLDELRINRAVHLALSKFGEELKKELNIK